MPLFALRVLQKPEGRAEGARWRAAAVAAVVRRRLKARVPARGRHERHQGREVRLEALRPHAVLSQALEVRARDHRSPSGTRGALRFRIWIC